jgi:CBS domain-containing protein
VAAGADDLAAAAAVMWDHDCGCVPVVDSENRPIAMLTDRDVCMAAYTQGLPLRAMSVSSAASKGIFTVASIGEPRSNGLAGERRVRASSARPA